MRFNRCAMNIKRKKVYKYEEERHFEKGNFQITNWNMMNNPVE